MTANCCFLGLQKSFRETATRHMQLKEFSSDKLLKIVLFVVLWPWDFPAYRFEWFAFCNLNMLLITNLIYKFLY